MYIQPKNEKKGQYDTPSVSRTLFIRGKASFEKRGSVGIFFDQSIKVLIFLFLRSVAKGVCIGKKDKDVPRWRACAYSAARKQSPSVFLL